MRMDVTSLRNHPIRRVFRVLLLLVVFPSFSIAQTPNWWTVNEGEFVDRGQFKELVNKKKVYVNVLFSDARPGFPLNTTDRNDITESVKQTIAAQKTLQTVTYPEEAEFAVIVRASVQDQGGPNFSLLLDTDTEVSIEVTVLIPGKKRRDGTIAPRLVWQAWSPNAQVEATSAARFTVDGFLWELKRLREKK